MLHTNRPLQEKMTLFWHNHFATAYTKLAGALTPAEATRYLAAKKSEDPGGVRGQIEMLRDNALGNFQTLLVEIAKDTAMLVWLDGRTNTRAMPQENFGREIMELFTMGVGHYTEADVYAAARVFTGWNLTRVVGVGTDPAASQRFFYNANQHDTDAKTFTFPIYTNGSRTIPARAASGGLQDGVDLIAAVARHPETARRLARKLYAYFVSEASDADPVLIDELASVYAQNDTNIRPMVRHLLTSPQFTDPANRHTRVLLAARVRRARSKKWLGRAVAERRSRRSQHGTAVVRTARRVGLEPGRDCTDGRYAGAHEFRGAARDQPEVQPRGRSQGYGSTPSGCLGTSSIC
jgi:uncharacterized protein (DUF1800 family)